MKKSPPEYRYKWLERIDPTESTGVLDFLANPDKNISYVPPVSSRILSYSWEQLRKANGKGDIRREWHRLGELLIEASEVERSQSPQAMCEMFFQIGQLCGLLSMPSLKAYSEGIDAKLVNWERERPLFERNLNSQTCKEIAQSLARSGWEKDTENAIRITEMANEVWAAFYQFKVPKEIMDCLPDRAEGIKTWLREVAPEYAKRGGAPKKTKN